MPKKQTKLDQIRTLREGQAQAPEKALQPLKQRSVVLKDGLSFPERIKAARGIVAALAKDDLKAFKEDLRAKIDYLQKQTAAAKARKEAEALAEKSADMLLAISVVELENDPPAPQTESGKMGGRPKKGRSVQNDLYKGEDAEKKRAEKERKAALRKTRHQLKGFETEEKLEPKVKEIKASGQRIVLPETIRAYEKKKAQKDRIEAAKNRKLDKGSRKKLRDFSLRTLSIEELRRFTEPNSIDLILTDPPYQKSDLQRFNELSHFAGHALKPGGTLLVLSGQLHFEECLIRLKSHSQINFRWVIAYNMKGPKSRIYREKFFQKWKPVFCLVKGKYEGEFVDDSVMIETYQKDKLHKWGQSVAGMEALLKLGFAFPGDTVCDPFLGAGSTAIAAYRFGCKFIGADIDKECVKIARGLLAEETDNDDNDKK